jgi:hypothetical protein
MERWKATRTGADAANPKCIYCNQKWHIPPTIPGENRRRDVSELDSRHVDDYGYVNLAQEAGLSSHRPDYNPFFSTRRRRRRRRYNYDYGYDSNCDCECCDHDEFERYEGDCDCECCFHS